MKIHWSTNCSDFKDGDETAEIRNEVDCATCLDKLRKAEQAGLVEDVITPAHEERNPLEFWVAYIPGEGDKKNYLSDGKGHIRVFKTEQAINDYLCDNLRPEVLEMVVVHPIQGQIAVPEDETPPAAPKIITLDQITSLPSIFPEINMDLSSVASITTLAPPSFPTAMELLDNYKKRGRKRSGRK